MSSAIKVGSGYIDVTPRLNTSALKAMQKRLDQQMKSFGATSGRQFGNEFIRSFNKASNGRIVFAGQGQEKAMRTQANRVGQNVNREFAKGLESENAAEKAFVRNFRSAMREARMVSAEARNVSQSVNVVRRQSQNLLNDFVRTETAFADQFRSAMNKASVVSQETVNTQRAVNRALRQSQSVMDELNATTTRTVETTSRGLRSLVGLGNVTNAQLRSASESIRQWSNRLQGFGQDWSLFVTAPIVGSIGVLSAWGLQVGAELQKAQIGIQRLAETAGMVTAEATSLANAQLADLRIFAEDSTFEFAPLANGVQRLMAAGVEAETATHWIKTLGDTTAAYGAGAQEMNRAIIAISQSMAAGKIYAQDMNQLNNAGIPIWRMMAEATGQTEAELRELGRAGELLSDDIWPDLIDYMGQYNGVAAEMGQTVPLYAWGNAVERFKNALGDLINGTNEAMDIVNPERPAMWIELFAAIEETLIRIVPLIGGILDYVVPGLTRGFEALNRFLDGFTNSSGEVDGFGVALLGIVAILGPLMVTIGFVGRGIASVVSGLRALPGNIQNLTDVVERLHDVGGAFDTTADSASDASAEFSDTSTKSQTLRERLQSLGQYLGDAAKSGWQKGTDLADAFGAKIVATADRIGDFGDSLRSMGNTIGGALVTAESKVVEFGQSVAAWGTVKVFELQDALVALPGKVNSKIDSITKRIADFRVDTRDLAGFIKLQLPQSWDEVKDRAQVAFEDVAEWAETKFQQIRESASGIVVTIKQRYEEAGGVGGIAKRGAQAAGRGAVSAARGTMGAIGALISMLDSILGPAMRTLGSAFSGAFEMLSPVLDKLAEAFSSAIMPALTAAILALTPALLAFTPIMEQLGAILGPVIESLAAALVPMLEQMVPILSEVLAQLAPFLTEIANFVVEIIGALAPILGELLVALMPLVETIGGAFMEVLNLLLPVLIEILSAISPMIPILGEFLMEAINTLLPVVFDLFSALSPLIPVLLDLLMAIMPILEALTPLIELFGIVIGLVISLAAPIISLASTILSWLIEKALVPLINKFGDMVSWITDKVEPGVEWLKEKLVDFTSTVKGKFEDFKESWDSIWDSIGAKAREIYEDWIEPVINGVGEAWDKVSGLFSGDDPGEPEGKALGGVLPGYAPGVDSIPALLSPGEGILRPEVVRWLGKTTIDDWNSGALRGEIPGFASGGVAGATGSGKKAAKDGASAVLSGPVLATPVPETDKMLDGLVGVYEDATGNIATDWRTNADTLTRTTDQSMGKVTSSSRQSMGEMTDRIVGPSMSKMSGQVRSGMNNAANQTQSGMNSTTNHVRSGMRDSVSETTSGMRSMTNQVSSGWSSIVNTTQSRSRSFVSTIQSASRDAKNHWSSMISDMNRSTRGMVNTSYSKGIVGVLSQMSSLAGVSNPLSAVRLSSGGVLPGYRPGVDTIPAMLSAGEAVLRPEVVKMIGTDVIDEWNRSARNGEVQHFASGGVVDGAAWVRQNKNKSYDGYADAFKGAVKDLIDPSLRHYAGFSGAYGSRAREDIRTGYDGIDKWLKSVDKAANSGGDASKVVEILRQEYKAGVSGRPNKYGPSEAWCANFASWVVDKANANKAYWNSPKGTPQNRWPAVATWESASARAGDYRRGTRGIQPGDIATYGGGGQHINIVEKVLGNGRFQTIGGNESDSVRRQTRSTARGYGRPRWGLSGSGVKSGPFKGLNVKAWPGQFTDDLAVDGGGVDRALSRGAVVNSPTRTLIGEAGPEAVLPLSDKHRTASLLEEIGLPHKNYHITINAAPDVPTEQTLLKALGYADTIYR